MPSLIMNDPRTEPRSAPDHTAIRGDTRALRLRAKAPLRVSFAGGGTDVAPFPETEGGAVLSATIARYAYGSLTPRPDGAIRISSEDLGVSLEFGVDERLTLDGELDLAKAAACHLGDLAGGERDGYELRIHSSAPPGSGLGSSSAVMVTLVGLLRDRYGLQMDAYQVAHTAHRLERHDLGIRGGQQDHYAAAFGGFNYIEFLGGDQVVVNPLRVRDDTLAELEHNLLLCFTGRTRASDNIIADQSARLAGAELDTVEGLRAQKELATAMKHALLRNRLRDFGALLDEAWEQKKRISPRISTAYIDEAYAAARAAGALGGKITGAGGGGFMLIYCDFDRRRQVAAALTDLDMTVEEITFAPTGLSTWSPR
ncbi:GHMP kinase [Paractinoplanes deccanensis]|uniref:GHMP kinase n=1 Tax=Paractinoplanes deccanensis TaxID=113561 RepID=A0ABQ3YE45_9ACTN|nr:GHMP kinase [Actinoplanes deccanensis]GID78253.1 GHMP kinase [Actinoplanes deccanensis]